jgi:hypothetical protein
MEIFSFLEKKGEKILVVPKKVVPLHPQSREMPLLKGFEMRK